MSNITKFLLLGAIAATVSACDTATGRAGGGALVGAALADATDENMVAGAALGALAGAASCGVAGLPPCRSGGNYY
ncbi:hypothetical protein GQR99_04045 [Cereibacter sphaeroides]|nr:hypothetical protein GQR99_04045 [Cereibacter sphaeroides]QHA12853.1 hypothetical protein GQY06_04030 [Cereibacter sphaeroides]